MTIIRTERLTLTPVAATDFDDLTQMWAEEGVTRYISGQPMSSEDVWLRLLRDIGHWQVLGYGNWVLRDHDETLVGSVGLFDYRRDLSPPFMAPEIGWAMTPPFHGKGLGREAVTAVLDYADIVLGFERTACMISHPNTPSIKLAEAVGFRHYGQGLHKGSTLGLYERQRPSTKS